jgi:hypothetical protein
VVRLQAVADYWIDHRGKTDFLWDICHKLWMRLTPFERMCAPFNNAGMVWNAARRRSESPQIAGLLTTHANSFVLVEMQAAALCCLRAIIKLVCRTVDNFVDKSEL